MPRLSWSLAECWQLLQGAPSLPCGGKGCGKEKGGVRGTKTTNKEPGLNLTPKSRVLHSLVCVMFPVCIMAASLITKNHSIITIILLRIESSYAKNNPRAVIGKASTSMIFK